MERETPERRSLRDRMRTIKQLGKFAAQEAFRQLNQLGGERRHYPDDWWRQRQKTAEQLMEERRANKSAHTLIVVAAMHPLQNGRPNEEFQARLLAGAHRAQELTTSGFTVEMWVPGSRHSDGDAADDITLSEAGLTFLKETADLDDGIVLHGDDLNEYYKGEAGVYNSGDEAYIAAEYFKDTPALGNLEVILGPAQQERWELHAVANGVMPILFPITPTSGMTYHDKLSYAETTMVAYTRRIDPTWQAPNSFMAKVSRTLRRPA